MIDVEEMKKRCPHAFGHGAIWEDYIMAIVQQEDLERWAKTETPPFEVRPPLASTRWPITPRYVFNRAVSIMMP